MKKPLSERTVMDANITQVRTGWVQLLPGRRGMVAQSCTQATQMWLDGNDCD